MKAKKTPRGGGGTPHERKTRFARKGHIPANKGAWDVEKKGVCFSRKK